MRAHRWWLAFVATLLTPWIGPHIDQYVPLGGLLLRVGAGEADSGFWVIAGMVICVIYLAWFGLLSGLAAWLARHRRDRGGSNKPGSR